MATFAVTIAALNHCLLLSDHTQECYSYLQFCSITFSVILVTIF